MAAVDPVADAPAAVADTGEDRALVVADYHAGVEAALRREGIQLDSRADERRERLLALLDRTAPDRLVFLGDLVHSIGEAVGAERREVEELLEAVCERVPVDLVKGNHDGVIEDVVEVPVSPTDGLVIGDVGFVHGHTWPARAVLEASVVCVGHEHPAVRLEDAVGGRRLERVWLRGRLAPAPFMDRYDDPPAIDGDLVVFPAFNDLVGATWVNLPDQDFLAPFLPEALAAGEAYLLDGTRLGAYDRI